MPAFAGREQVGQGLVRAVLRDPQRAAGLPERERVDPALGGLPSGGHAGHGVGLVQAAQAGERLYVLCLGAGKRVRRLGNIVAHIKSRTPVKAGEGPFQLSRDEVRNIGYHLRTMYRRDAQVCKQLLLRLNDELTRSTTASTPRITASAPCCRSSAP